MPTGYTDVVRSGEVTEFRDYALRCARAFGALVTMREDSLGVEIPEKFEYRDGFYRKNIERNKAELAELEAMSEKECEKRCEEAYNDRVKNRNEELQRVKEELERYNSMLEKVLDYQSPSPDHDGFAKFMRTQLEESIELDCNCSWLEDEPIKEPPEAWRKSKIQDCKQSIEYSERHIREEKERVDSRNEWLRLLRESLKED